MNVTCVRAFLALLAALLVNMQRISAADPHAPSCGDNTTAANYAPLGAPPNVRYLKDSRAPLLPLRGACPEISIPEFGSFVEVAGTFRDVNGKEALLSRIGDISDLVHVRYWSTTSQGWRQLISSATALTAGDRPRKDFTAVELENGGDLFLSQTDNRSTTAVTYRMRLRDDSPQGFVLEVDNVSPVRWWLLTLYNPGELRSVYIVHQESADIWTYYSLTSVGNQHWLPAGNDNSYVNRVVALYRHYIGIPTDSEPPPAP